MARRRPFCVVLVPSDGSSLLEDGRCGSRPPVAAKVHSDGRWAEGNPERPPPADAGMGTPLGLVVAWDGQVLFEGAFLAARHVCEGLRHEHYGHYSQGPLAASPEGSHVASLRFPRVVVIEHGSTGVAAARFDGWCSACSSPAAWSPTFILEDWILPYEGGLVYRGSREICVLDFKASGHPGERMVDMLALAIIGEARGLWRRVVLDLRHREIESLQAPLDVTPIPGLGSS
jgi:hypothetical protein